VNLRSEICDGVDEVMDFAEIFPDLIDRLEARLAVGNVAEVKANLEIDSGWSWVRVRVRVRLV
jgi:hypothetical protein